MPNRSVHPFFAVPDAAWHLSFSSDAVVVLEKHAQRKWFQSESVGQLFTRDLTQPRVIVDKATVLKPRRSSWSSVTFDPSQAFAQRETLLKEGLFCIGIWHTHPESAPQPSGTDGKLAQDHAEAARSVLNAIAFVIVGNRIFPDGWFIGFHDGIKFHEARRLP